jgi:hypothetical protein
MPALRVCLNFLRVRAWQVLGRREADLRNQFKLPGHLTMGNFAGKGGAHNEGTTEEGGLAK